MNVGIVTLPASSTSIVGILTAGRKVSTVGKPYNFLVIFILALRILGFKFFSDKLLAAIAKHDGYICSELVAECYRTGGYVVVNEKDYLVNPGDLAERLIYQ